MWHEHKKKLRLGMYNFLYRAAYLCVTVVIIFITCHINKDYPASSAIGRHIDIGTCLLVKYTCRVFQNR